MPVLDAALAMLCIKIFFCRILDVSLSTVRTILSVKGKTPQATVIGFFEVLVWFLIVREALSSDAGGLTLAIAYAGGFAAGTYVGGMLAAWLIKGDITLQVITSSRDNALLDAIREAGFAISVVNVNSSDYGADGKRSQICRGRLDAGAQIGGRALSWCELQLLVYEVSRISA